MRRNGKLVAMVVDVLGGAARAADIAGATKPTIYKWRHQNRVRSAEAVLQFAARIQPHDKAQQLHLARRLAGLDK